MSAKPEKRAWARAALKILRPFDHDADIDHKTNSKSPWIAHAGYHWSKECDRTALPYDTLNTRAGGRATTPQTAPVNVPARKRKKNSTEEPLEPLESGGSCSSARDESAERSATAYVASLARAASEFTQLEPSCVYLDSAGRTPLPDAALNAGLVAMRLKAATPWQIGDTTADRDANRALFAALLGTPARPDDICLVPSCSYAMTLASRNCRRHFTSSKRRVVLLEGQMASNVLCWQQLVVDVGGELCIVKRPSDYDWTLAVELELDRGDVAVCALPPAHWCDGSTLDLASIGKAARARGAALVVDATQWIGATAGGLPVADCSFIAASVHKWLLGPYGTCLCYCAPGFWEDAEPLEHHDRNRVGADKVECLPMGAQGYPTDFLGSAQRLDSGGRPSYIVMPMLRTSLELVLELGPARIARHTSALTRRIRDEALQLGFDAPPSHAPHLIGLWPSPRMPTSVEIVRWLAVRPTPVRVAERFGAIRVSPYLFNTEADVDVLVKSLAEAIQSLPEGR